MKPNKTLFAGLTLVLTSGAAIAAPLTAPLKFVGIAPCRIIDTRAGQGFSGAFGPPALVANANRTFQITGTTTGTPTQCGIPDAAVAISVNFTVTGFAGQGDIRVFPAGGTLPNASILNFQLENIANATTVPLGPSGSGHNGIAVRADAVTTEFIADVNGYYVPSNTLASGQSISGTWVASTVATAASDFLGAQIPFAEKLATAPNGNFMAPGATPTASCPGSVAAPTAAAGQLCVYADSCLNANLTCVASASGTCGTVSTFGALVGFLTGAAGEASCYGSWAVTAP